MVIHQTASQPRRAFAIAEILMAILILSIALLPICYSVQSDARGFRASCQHAAAMEIVDGEMEILAAGEWRYLPEGTHPYAIHADLCGSLPPGIFQLTRHGNHLHLQWSAAKKSGIGLIVRDVTVK